MGNIFRKTILKREKEITYEDISTYEKYDPITSSQYIDQIIYKEENEVHNKTSEEINFIPQYFKPREQ
jgi:hypothetical protein